MKYTVVAAALVSAVAADGWESWSATSSWDPPPPPPKPTATTEWQTWSTSTVDDPATWSSWDPKHPPPPPPKPTSTWETWGTWASTTTSAKCSYVTEIATSKCIPGHPDQCWPYKKTSTVYPDVCTDITWADWNTWTTPTPVAPTYAECSYVSEVPVTHCWPGDKDHGKHCWVKTETSTVYPTECPTWGVWETTITVPGDTTITETWYPWVTKTPVVPVDATTTWAAWTSETPVVVTSIVSAGWEENGWFGPAWPVADDGQCVTNVVTSYGYPIWQPTPEASTVVVETTWAEWSSTPVAPVAETTWATWSSPVEPVAETTTWAEWSTPVAPVVKTTWATWSSPVEPVAETTTWAEWSSTPVAPVVETTWATWTGKAVSTPKPAKGGKAPIAPNGNQWAVTYGPYDSAGKCKTEEVIKVDVKKIKDAGFTTIRVYSTDCNTLEYIGEACRENGLTIILGVFISKTGIEGAKSQVEEIVTWSQWDIVELVVIGNEAVFQGFCQPSELVEFITYCKTKFAACGYTGPCTTTEPLGEWQKSSDLYCGVVDVVSANLYAYFNADCPAENAGEFIQSQITILNGLCSGKETYVMECGWPSEGSCNGKACAGKKEQEVAITGIKSTCGAKIVFFNYEDEHWKQPGQFGVEQHWGLYDVFAGKGDNWSSWSKY